MKKDVLSAIEITDTHVKLLQAKTIGGKRVLCACEIRPVTDPTDETIVGILKKIKIFKEIHPENLVVAIPRRFAMLRQMRLPSHHEAEIKKMISLQLVNQIPYPIEDVICEHELLGKEDSGYARVLVTIVHKQVSGRYLKLLKDAGMSAESFLLSSMGLLGWLDHQKKRKEIASAGTVLLINMDAAHCEICFCHDGKLFFSRSIPHGAGDLGGDEAPALLNQIELSLKNYRGESMGPEVAKMIILSTHPRALLLKEQLEKETQISTAVFSPLEGILCQRKMNPAALKDHPGLSLAVGLGFLLADSRKAANFLPREVHEVKRTKFRKIQRVKLAVFLALTVISAMLIPWLGIHQQRIRLLETERAAQEMDRSIEEAKQRMRFVQLFDEELRRRVFIADLVQELNALMPPDVSLRLLHFDRETGLNIQGYAQLSGSVNSLQAGLVKSPMFTDVNLEYASKRKIFNMEVTDFKIILRLSALSREPAGDSALKQRSSRR